MPTAGEWGALVAAVLSGAGIGSVVRAWGQNRNERHGTLTDEQKDFRESQRQSIHDLIERNEYLRGRLDAIDVRNSELVIANAELRARAEIQDQQLERMADQVTVGFAERERLKRQVVALETEVRELHDDIASLRRRRDPNARTRSTDVVSGD